MSKYIEFQRPIDELPKICIHVHDDLNIKFYDADKVCSCGYSDWIKSRMELKNNEFSHQFLPLFIERCRLCNEIRLARLKKKYERIITASESILNALRKVSDNDEEWFSVIENMYAKLGRKLGEQENETVKL